MSREPFGRPPTTRTRHCAPIAAASSMARWLSSSAARRPAASAAGNMPPRHRPVTVIPCARISCAARSTPQACTMSRQGEIAEMPARAQPSTSSTSDHGFTVIELIDRSERSFDRSRITPARRGPPSRRRMRPAARSGSASRPAASASRNSSARCKRRARALLAADQGEMILQAIEIGHEHHAGLVEARRRLEDVTRQRHGRRQNVMEGLASPRVNAPSADAAAGAITSKMPSSASEYPARRRRSAPHS